MQADRRTERRHRLRVPVTLERGTGVTRDISINGVFFETEQQFVPNQSIWFTVAFETPRMGDVAVRYEGTVVRVDRTNPERIGVAVAIDRFGFESFDN